MESENVARNCHHEGTRGLVHIGLYTEWAGGREILLRVPGVAITCISRQPPIEVISVAQQKAAGVRGVLVDPISARILRKDPVPWALISCQCPSWAIAPPAHIRTPRTAATTIFRIIFLFLPVLDFLHNDKLDSIEPALLDNLNLTRECRRLGLDSVTMPWADYTIRAGETQKIPKSPILRQTAASS